MTDLLDLLKQHAVNYKPAPLYFVLCHDDDYAELRRQYAASPMPNVMLIRDPSGKTTRGNVRVIELDGAMQDLLTVKKPTEWK